MLYAETKTMSEDMEVAKSAFRRLTVREVEDASVNEIPSEAKTSQHIEEDVVSADDQSPLVLDYRAIVEGDCDKVRKIHEECFPLRYDDKFYEGLAVHKYNNAQLFTRVVSYDRIENDVVQKHVVAGITSQITHVNRCVDAQLLSSQSMRRGYTHCCYILTISVTKKFRRKSIASNLLNLCIDNAKSNSKCGCIYLHVISYNVAAMRFYKAHGFSKLKRVENFYKINKVFYDSFIFVLYLKGCNQPSLPWYARIANYLDKTLNYLVGYSDADSTLSEYKGVYRQNNTWKVYIKQTNGKSHVFGNFSSETEAAHAYDKEALRLFGEKANLNFPDEHRHLIENNTNMCV